MEDLATTPFETPAQEWQWMEASVQDEVSVRAVEEAARAHAEQAQAQAEEEARLAAAARSEAEDASERDQRARLVAEASEKAAKEETETWWVKPLSLPCRKTNRAVSDHGVLLGQAEHGNGGRGGCCRDARDVSDPQSALSWLWEVFPHCVPAGMPRRLWTNGASWRRS